MVKQWAENGFEAPQPTGSAYSIERRVKSENSEAKWKSGGVERSDIIPLNLIDSIWQRPPPPT